MDRDRIFDAAYCQKICNCIAKGFLKKTRSLKNRKISGHTTGMVSCRSSRFPMLKKTGKIRLVFAVQWTESQRHALVWSRFIDSASEFPSDFKQRCIAYHVKFTSEI